jgi:hypothetical protein
MVRRSFLYAALCVAPLLFAASASAQVFRVGEAFPLGGTAQIDHVDVAYDPVNNRYFKVNEGAGHTRIEGQLIDPTRAPESRVVSNVTVNDGGDNNQFPRVSYSPHVGTAGGYLVTWNKGFGNIALVVGRLINHNGDAIGGEITIASTPSNWLINAPSAYTTGSSANTREFLVVWGGFTGSDIFGQRVSPAGALVGTNFIVSAGGPAVYDHYPSIGYNPVTNKFLVGWGAYDEAARNGYAAARMVGAGSSTELGSIWTFDNAGISITAVAYNSTANRFLFSWYRDAGGSNKAHYGVLLEANGAVVPNGSSSIRVLSAIYSAYDALDIEHNVPSGEYLLVTHGKSPFDWEDAGVTIKADGTAYDNGFRVTFTDSALKGNWYPRVATASARKEWLVVTSSGLRSVIGQFLGSNSSGGNPPPPPPPSCSFTIGSTAATVPPVAMSSTVSLTASGTTCAWSASVASTAPWITLQNSSGTGSATVTFNVTRNLLQPARIGTITIGGQAFTVTQRGLNRQALDFNLDEKIDLLVQHRTEGWLGTWKMNGTSLLDGQLMIPDRVPDTRWTVVGTADFTNDGWSDILWQHTDGSLAVWTMSGVFMQAVNYTNPQRLPTNWRARGIADMNGDGKPDIVVQNMSTGDAGVWFMNGLTAIDGRLFNPGSVPDTKWKIVGTDDFNGDGQTDLLWQHDDNAIAIWYMNGINRTSVEWLSPSTLPTADWKVVAVADLNTDGKPDIVFQNRSTNGLIAWIMSGHARADAVTLSPSTIAPNWSIVGPR